MDAFSLHSSPEGIERLKQLLGIYMRTTGHGFQIVAKGIRDPSAPDYDDEVRDVRAALGRWMKGGQKALWLNPEKRIGYLARLERFLKGYPLTRREIVNFQAAQWRDRTGKGFAAFFYAGIPDGSIEAAKATVAGLHHTLIAQFSNTGDAVWTGGLHQYHYFRSEIGPYMTAQEFSVADTGRYGPVLISARRMGFAFPHPSGQIYRFMRNVEFPSEQTMDLISPPLTYSELLEEAAFTHDGPVQRISRTFVERSSQYGIDESPWSLGKLPTICPTVSEKRYLISQPNYWQYPLIADEINKILNGEV